MNECFFFYMSEGGLVRTLFRFIISIWEDPILALLAITVLQTVVY